MERRDAVAMTTQTASKNFFVNNSNTGIPVTETQTEKLLVLLYSFIICTVKHDDSTGRVAPEIRQSGPGQQNHRQEISKGEFAGELTPVRV